jgi:hypothetical protein
MAPLSMIKKGYLLSSVHICMQQNMICKLSLTTDPVGGVANADDNKKGNGLFLVCVSSIRYIDDEFVLQLPKVSYLRVTSLEKISCSWTY